ncbi:MAG: hypothetical protein AVDCRST_MAG65-1086, partial [uncultured Solirubrobacteraceae bacterium]
DRVRPARAGRRHGPLRGRRRSGAPGHLAAQGAGFRRLRGAGGRRPLLPGAAPGGPGGDLGSHRGRGSVLAAAGAGVHHRLLRRLRGDVPWRLRARRHPHRLARELPDHDVGQSRRASLRGGRSRRRGADRVGAAALRHVPAPGGRQVGLLRRPHLPGLRPRAADLRRGSEDRRVPRSGALRRHGAARGDRRGGGGGGAGDRLRSDRLPAPRGAARAWQRDRRPLGAPSGQRAGRRLGGHSRCDRPSRQPRSGAAGRARLLGLPDRRAVGGLPRVRRVAAARGAGHGLLRRHVRQPAADARWRGRSGGRDDRRAGRLQGRARPGLRRGARLPGLRLLAADAARSGRLLPAAAHRRPLARGAARASARACGSRCGVAGDL